MACVCNPIWINSFVVFVRLYWFEKRFQSIVEEAREQRRSKTRSRTKSESRGEMDIGVLERGVRDKKITVVRDHPANGPVEGNDKSALSEHFHHAIKEEGSSSSSDDRAQQWREALDHQPSNHTNEDHQDKATPGHQREIMFADEVQRDDGTDAPPSRLPRRVGTDQHIAFLEGQRKHDKGALRIPGPRDFARGEKPKPLAGDGEDDSHEETTKTEAEGDGALQEKSENEEINLDDHPVKRGITFEALDHPEHLRMEDVPTYNSHSRNLTLHGLGKRQSSDPNFFSGLRQRTRSFREHGSLAKIKSEERVSMPYLSWEATVGRNSLFIGLTEEQREELGGIEYRALKTLAVVLVVYFFGFHLFGFICLVPWIVRSGRWGSVVTGDGIGRPWW